MGYVFLMMEMKNTGYCMPAKELERDVYIILPRSLLFVRPSRLGFPIFVKTYLVEEKS